MAERFTELIGRRPPRVEKQGDPEALDREAAALGAVTGRSWVPALMRHEPGRLVSARVPGGPRALAGLGPADARRLGAVLREVHETRRSAAGGLWWWRTPARDLTAYGRGGCPMPRPPWRAPRTPGWRTASPPSRCRPGDGFGLLHGDLVAVNVLWAPGGGPVLIDWEFHRIGDPAEDLAYLAEVNGLPDAVLAAVLAGHGMPGMGARVEGWRGLAAADAGGWYLGQGMAGEAGGCSRVRGRAPP